MLQTPVTSAPNDFAICTAKVPTPPEAPLIKTFCPGWRSPLITQSLQGGQRGQGHGRRLLERQVGRLRRQQVSRDTGVLGTATRRDLSSRICSEARPRPPEYLIAWAELGHGLAHRLNLPRQVPRQNVALPGLRSPKTKRAVYGRPRMECQSVGLTEAARTRTST